MGNPSDPVLNCLLEVCCGAARAEEGLAKFFASYGVEESAAKQCAAMVYTHFELAPRGSLTQFKQDIARVAKA